MCSISADVEPTDPVSVSARPLRREIVIDIEPVSVLMSDVCSVSVEAAPREPDSIMEFPLATIVVMISDPVRLSARPFFSALDTEMVPVRVLDRPLISTPVREIEPVNALDSPRCSASPEDMVRDPVRVLSRDT